MERGDVSEHVRTRRLATTELTDAELIAIRKLMEVAFADDEDGPFDDDDWQHALGGVHVVLDVDGVIVAHASVVERDIHIARQPLRTGYVEAVATAPGRQGLGTKVMEAIGSSSRPTSSWVCWVPVVITSTSVSVGRRGRDPHSCAPRTATSGHRTRRDISWSC